MPRKREGACIKEMTNLGVKHEHTQVYEHKQNSPTSNKEMLVGDHQFGK